MVKSLYPNIIIVSSMNGIDLSGLTVVERAIIIKKMKEQGFVKGFPDLEVIIPNGKTLYFELKQPNGKGVQSKEQKVVESQLTELGHSYVLLNSIESFFKHLNTELGTEYCQRLYEAYNGEFSDEMIKNQYGL